MEKQAPYDNKYNKNITVKRKINNKQNLSRERERSH